MPPDIFAPFEQQLGMKLESTRAPVDVLVIEKTRGLRRIEPYCSADDLKSMPEWQQPQLSEAPTTRPPRPQGGSVGMMPPAGGANSNSRDQ